jgi:transketolase
MFRGPISNTERECLVAPAEIGAGTIPEGVMDVGQLSSNTIKGLAMDAVQRANSGHPGAPMGMADIATVLWSQFVKYDPSCPDWADRDRVILSNGHGSMLLYSMLHLTGTALSLDDLKDFRQWGSRTAGHPEFGEAPGIETTTGPLGQGFANGVGMAFAERWLNHRFGDDLVDHYTWILCGDGCLMEGISHESASLAGHLGLDRMIVLYDDNKITIDGSTDRAFTEDVGARFAAYGWQVLSCDGHDQSAIADAIRAAKADTDRPSIVCCRTVIGNGAPSLQGTAKTHGAPLGPDEIRAAKLGMGFDPEVDFAVPEAVLEFYRKGDADRRSFREAWQTRLAGSAKRGEWNSFHDELDLDTIEFPTFETGKIATRKSNQKVLDPLAEQIRNLVGGSADLTGSNGSYQKDGGDIERRDFAGRNLFFGVREHGMAAMCNGIALHGGMIPYCATFLTFHDYMRPAVRLSALMRQRVIYIYTHDSVWLGEDGPTHQPVEHIQSMRSMINVWVVRPGDANESAEAWKIALARTDGPTAICLTRQGLATVDRTIYGSAAGTRKGGYILADAEGAEVVLIATGSEVELALKAQEELRALGTSARVVSMPCVELYQMQDGSYKDSVLPPGIPRVSIEAGITYGWAEIVGSNGASVGIDRYGASAPGEVVADKLGMNVENVLAAVRKVI